MKILGTIGDVNPLQYGGGFVFEQDDGEVWIEYAEEPCDDAPWFRRNGYKEYDLPLRAAPYTVYRVEVHQDIKADLSWLKNKDWAALAARNNGKTSKAEGEDLAYALSECAAPMERAMLYCDVALHFGWENLDSYPLQLSGEELATRWELNPTWGDKVCEVKLWADTAQTGKELFHRLGLLELSEEADMQQVFAGLRQWVRDNYTTLSQFESDLTDAMEEAGFTHEDSPSETEEDE